MFDSEITRKVEILKANFALAEFIDDISLEKTVNDFNDLSCNLESQSRWLWCQLDYAWRLCDQKNLILKRIETTQQKGAIVAEDWELQFDNWFKSFRNRMKAAFESYLLTMNSCVNPVITGPAKCMRRPGRTANDKYTQIDEYAKRAPERFLRRIILGDGTNILSNVPNASDLLVRDEVEELGSVNLDRCY